ncbi:MAG: serine hydrolase [Gemmatimonadota bacterium]|jgi:CubicO group peptidase (beta-lactamase class C family)
MTSLHRTVRAAPAALLALALAVSACSDAPTAVTFDVPVDLTAPWRTADPAAAGMDASRLNDAVRSAQAISRLRSLLVVRRGRLVLEHYQGGAGRDDLADVRSVTKSVVSTLTGLAVARGELTSLNQTLGDILPESVANLDEVERTIAVADLLTMSGGWDWEEAGAVGYNEWITADDPIGYLLDRPHVAEPGTTFAYNSAAVHLLGVALEEAVGEPLPAFADQVLFGPLGIASRRWEVLGEGRVNGGSGLDLRPRDLARIGQLFLQDGVSGGTRVLPGGWVAEATRTRYAWRSPVASTHVSYGYLWWTDEDNDAWFAWGYGGQFIYVAPRRDLVVVATTAWWRIDGESIPPGLESQVLGVIVDGVLPAAPEG